MHRFAAPAATTSIPGLSAPWHRGEFYYENGFIILWEYNDIEHGPDVSSESNKILMTTAKKIL